MSPSDGARPVGRDLEPEEIQDFVADLARRPERWEHLVRHDEDTRITHEIHRDEHVTVWLMCWSHDQDTGFHDHDVSAGAVAVIDGAVREDRLVLGGPPATRIIGDGGSFSFRASDIHRVLHAGDRPAVTLHAYSPPLERMGAYVVEPDGALRRFAVPLEEELRPLSAAP